MKTLLILVLILLSGCTVVLKSPCYVMKQSVSMSDEVIKYTYYDVKGNCPPVTIWSSEIVSTNDTLKLNK